MASGAGGQTRGDAIPRGLVEQFKIDRKASAALVTQSSLFKGAAAGP